MSAKIVNSEFFGFFPIVGKSEHLCKNDTQFSTSTQGSRNVEICPGGSHCRSTA